MSINPEPLPPAVAALLASERAFPPQAEDRRQRVLARARVALTGPGVSRWRGSVLHRLVGSRWLAAVTVGIATAAAWAAVRDGRRKPVSMPASFDSVQHSPSAISPREPRARDAEEVPPEASPPAIPSSADSARHGARRLGPASSSRRTARDDGYDVELRVLEPARSAMARGELATALAAIAEHKRRFPAGKLAEEREALRIKALLGLGHEDMARAAAAEFRNTFPTSVLLPRVEEMVDAAP